MDVVKRKANLIPYLRKNKDIYFYLSRRSKTAKQYPDCFSFWGGGIEEKEIPEKAMQREIKEELNYMPSKYSYLGKFYDSMPNEKYVYYCEVGNEFEGNILRHLFDR